MELKGTREGTQTDFGKNETQVFPCQEETPVIKGVTRPRVVPRDESGGALRYGLSSPESRRTTRPVVSPETVG